MRNQRSRCSASWQPTPRRRPNPSELPPSKLLGTRSAEQQRPYERHRVAHHARPPVSESPATAPSSISLGRVSQRLLELSSMSSTHPLISVLVIAVLIPVIFLSGALCEVAFGNSTEARQAASDALKQSPTSQAVEVEAALALATAGDRARAKTLTQDLAKRFPLDTVVQSLWLPTIRAQLAITGKNPTAAIHHLQDASSIELGWIIFATNVSCLYPIYVRGEAYLAGERAASP
jgi:hypothetical protein